MNGVRADAKELDEAVEAFRTRPLDAGPYTFSPPTLVLKVREAGRVVGVHTLIATGVNAEGYREILGIQVTSAEDGAGWLAFFRDLVARGQVPEGTAKASTVGTDHRGRAADLQTADHWPPGGLASRRSALAVPEPSSKYLKARQRPARSAPITEAGLQTCRPPTTGPQAAEEWERVGRPCAVEGFQVGGRVGNEWPYARPERGAAAETARCPAMIWRRNGNGLADHAP